MKIGIRECADAGTPVVVAGNAAEYAQLAESVLAEMPKWTDPFAPTSAL